MYTLCKECQCYLTIKDTNEYKKRRTCIVKFVSNLEIQEIIIRMQIYSHFFPILVDWILKEFICRYLFLLPNFISLSIV